MDGLLAWISSQHHDVQYMLNYIKDNCDGRVYNPQEFIDTKSSFMRTLNEFIQTTVPEKNHQNIIMYIIAQLIMNDNYEKEKYAITLKKLTDEFIFQSESQNKEFNTHIKILEEERESDYKRIEFLYQQLTLTQKEIEKLKVNISSREKEIESLKINISLIKKTSEETISNLYNELGKQTIKEEDFFNEKKKCEELNVKLVYITEQYNIIREEKLELESQIQLITTTSSQFFGIKPICSYCPLGVCRKVFYNPGIHSDFSENMIHLPDGGKNWLEKAKTIPCSNYPHGCKFGSKCEYKHI